MVYPGHIQNGMVILEGGVSLPDGLPVHVDAGTGSGRRPPHDSQLEIDVAESLERVKQFTSQIYPGEAAIVQREDNEIAGDRHFTFCVADAGDTADIMARYNQWHSRLGELSTNVRRMFRLSIDAH